MNLRKVNSDVIHFALVMFLFKRNFFERKTLYGKVFFDLILVLNISLNA